MAVEARRQPVAAVFGEPPGQRRPPGLEGGLPGQYRLAVRGDAVRDGHREPPLGRVDADVDVGRVPGVRRVDVIGAGRGRADQVGQGAQQHIVAGPRPGLVEEQLVGLVEVGVVEEVQRGPAAPLRDAERPQLGVEVVGAVDVTGIPLVLVVLGVAGQREGVVPADGVPDHLDQRAHVLVEELAEQARLRVGAAHQVARRGGVQAALRAVGEPAAVKGQEIRALPAGHVDDLDVLARLDLVGAGGAGRYPQVEHGVGERGGQPWLSRRPRAPPAHLDGQVRRRVVGADQHHSAGGRDDAGEGLLRDELNPLAAR
jgi:hypothetical protein